MNVVTGCRFHVAEENMKVVQTYRLQVAGCRVHVTQENMKVATALTIRKMDVCGFRLLGTRLR